MTMASTVFASDNRITTAANESFDSVEAALRHDLAAAYRLVALFGWEDLVATHISVRLPDNHSFLINPHGMLFNEITPADLVKVDMDGNILSETKWKVNVPGFVIHSAIHAVRHDATCAMHLHTPDGIAVSTLEEGLLPLTQTSMATVGDIAFHEFEGFAFNIEERERLAADLGTKNLMFLRNHGTLSLGATIPQAFVRMYQFETACTIQVRALGMGRPIHPISQEVIDRTIAGRASLMSNYADVVVWPALLRKLDQADPNWRG
jgi:ribulose-5-phosphate 4-epimerase/fuculose-1-phosphate aldolase